MVVIIFSIIIIEYAHYFIFIINVIIVIAKGYNFLINYVNSFGYFTNFFKDLCYSTSKKEETKVNISSKIPAAVDFDPFLLVIIWIIGFSLKLFFSLQNNKI